MCGEGGGRWEGGVCVWCNCVGVNVIVWVGVGVNAWVRECVGGAALIAAVKYVCVCVCVAR